MVDAILPDTPRSGTLSRISWGSVIGGALVAIAVMFVLGEMSVAIDLGLLKPLDPAKDAAIPAIAAGGAIAWVVSALIALFIGSWSAGRLARQANETDTVLHGLLVWALGTVLIIAVGATAAGTVVGGAFSVAGSAVKATGSAVGGAAKAAGSAAGGADNGAATEAASALGVPSFNWDSIKTKMQKIVKERSGNAPGNAGAAGTNGQTPDANPTSKLSAPDATSGQAQNGQTPGAAGSPATKDAASQGAQDGDDEDLLALSTRLFGSATATVNDEDRKALAAALVSQGGLTPDQANRQVQKWEDAAKKAKAKYEQLKAEAEQKAREAAAATAKALSAAAWLGFVTMVLAASASMLGAHFGGPRRGAGLPESDVVLGATRAL